MLQAHFYRASAVTASGFLRQQIPFSAKSGMHWRLPHRFLSQNPLKTRVKPQKQLLQLFYEKGVFRNFVNFIVKHLYRSLFLIELQAKKLKHRCFPMEFVKFLETGVYKRLLLKPVVSPTVSSNYLRLVHGFHCVKSVQVWSFLWSVLSRSWTEYGEIQSIEIRSNCAIIYSFPCQF